MQVCMVGRSDPLVGGPRSARSIDPLPYLLNNSHADIPFKFPHRNVRGSCQCVGLLGKLQSSSLLNNFFHTGAPEREAEAYHIPAGE